MKFELRKGVLFVELRFSFCGSFQTIKKSDELSAGSCLLFMFFGSRGHGETTGKHREICARISARRREREIFFIY